MSRYLVRHARDGLDLEDSLWLGTEGDSRFEGVLDAMIAKKLQQIGRVLINNDICAGDVDSEAVGEEFLLVL